MMQPCMHSQYRSGIPGGQCTESVLAVQPVSLRWGIHVDPEDVRGRLVLDVLDEGHRAVEEPAERSGRVLGVEILARGASTGRGVSQLGKQPPSQVLRSYDRTFAYPPPVVYSKSQGANNRPVVCGGDGCLRPSETSRGGRRRRHGCLRRRLLFTGDFVQVAGSVLGAETRVRIPRGIRWPLEV
jgi:hypothetical protein